MKNEQELKATVKEMYGAIANQPRKQNLSSCCGATGCCDKDVFNIMADDYSSLEGYNPEADLGLGCGLPTEFAKMKKGDTVLDLGSGAGNDIFIARNIVGDTGKLIGIDFTGKMIDLARANAEKLSFNNVEFRQGDIESMPITANHVDVIVSNCVLNLVPNKHKAFSEMYRVLKPGGHFSISDIVLEGALPAKWKQVAELYAGCVAGAITKDEYLQIIKEAGFGKPVIQKEKVIILPPEILADYLSPKEMDEYKNSRTKILSITVYAEKPAKDDRSCCEPGSGCC
ncbi:MAG: arsenite methyltransferase [Chitinophagaceae bacterium]